MALFADRADAGMQLAAHLERWRTADAVVLGLPRGGVVVAAAVARELGLPLGVEVVRKLGAPANEELALGAIAEGVRIVDDELACSVGATPGQLAEVERRERAELERRRRAFGAAPLDVAGRTVIVVDDGVATGATMAAACRAVRARGAARVIAAVPVAPADWHPDAAVDAVVCPHPQRALRAVGLFYDDFTQTTDGEVERLLAPDLPGD